MKKANLPPKDSNKAAKRLVDVITGDAPKIKTGKKSLLHHPEIQQLINDKIQKKKK